VAVNRDCNLVRHGFSVSPLPPAALLEEGREWWGKYPEDLRDGFRSDAWPSALHAEKLPVDYFPILGSVPKKFSGKNRRFVDMEIAQFENDTSQEVDRSKWGLTVPNVEAAYLSLSKYAKSTPQLDERKVDAINLAFDWMTKHFQPYMCNSRVKTVEEVLPKLDLSTSPGFPWTRKYARKVDLLEQRPEFLSQYVSVDWDGLMSPDYTAVFGNSLKEEVRPQEKLDLNKIRTFTAGPIEMTIHGNRLFQDMNEKLYASHLQTASVVGFSPQYQGWDRFYRKLCSHPKGFATDGKEYDSSLRQYLMWGCAKFRWDMLRPEDQTEDNRLRVQHYYMNLVNTLIITSEGVFVRKELGNPSGSVNTISDNTLILYVLLAYAWIMVVPDRMCKYEVFNKSVALALCGDDNTWTVSDEASVYYNARSVIDTWAGIGVTGTTDTYEPRTAEELDFLSAHTVFYKGFAIPLYDREKLLTSLLYSRQPDNPSLTLTRAAAFLRVGWADSQARKYLKEIISWLVLKYGPVLSGTEEWRLAIANIPTNDELEELFIGLESQAMEHQSLCIPAIKDLRVMQRQLPQRQRVGRQSQRQMPRTRTTRARLPFPQPRRAQRPAVKRRQGPRNRGASMGMGAMTETMPRGRGVSQVKGTSRVTTDYPFHGREFIADVTSTTSGYLNLAYPINPGQASMFPWLNKEAQLYEKYMFTQLSFQYLTVTNELQPVSIGKAILAVDYDASDSPPSSKIQVEDSEPNKTCAPYQNMTLSCRPSDLNGSIGWHYVRPAGLPGASDIKTYDCGNLNVGVSANGVDDVKIGELWVTYRGMFKDRVLESVSTAPANNSVAWFTSDGGGETVGGGITAFVLDNAGNVNGLGVVITVGSMVPPAGNYLVDSNVQVDSTAAMTSFALSLWKNGADLPNYNNCVVAQDAAAIATQLFGSASNYVTANGSDFFTLIADATSTGTVTGWGSVRWLAV